MTLPYIWPNVQPSEWVLHNLNIDISARPNGLLAGQGDYEEGGWKAKNWEIEGRGGPWSIEGGDLGSGGLSGGVMGLQRLLLQPTQPNPESLAENVPWPVTEFEAFFW